MRRRGLGRKIHDAVAAEFEDVLERGVAPVLWRWFAITSGLQAAAMLLFSSIAA